MKPLASMLLFVLALGLIAAAMFNYESYFMGDMGQIMKIRLKTMHKIDQLQEEFKNAEQSLKSCIEGIGRAKIQQLVTKWAQNYQTQCSLEDVLVNRVHIINILLAQGASWNQQQTYLTAKRILSKISSSFNINLSLTNQKKPAQNGVILRVQEMRWDYFDQNIASRLRRGEYHSEHYMRGVHRHMKTLPQLKHCHYTSLPCSQTTIFIADSIRQSQIGEGGYWKAEDELFITNNSPTAQTLYTMLLDAYGLKDLMLIKDFTSKTEIYQHSRQLCRMKRFQQVLEYIEYISRPSNFSLSHLIDLLKSEPSQAMSYVVNGQYITPYIHQQQEIEMLENFIKSIDSKQRVGFNPMTDSRIGRIDLFPNDFKIGVYLPLGVITIYPLVLVLKNWLVYLFTHK